MKKSDNHDNLIEIDRQRKQKIEAFMKDFRETFREELKDLFESVTVTHEGGVEKVKTDKDHP